MLLSPTPVAKRQQKLRAKNWQSERRELTRLQLLTAAADTFGRLGYVGTRVEDILTASGVGRTSFYKHFRDRLDIASVLFTEFMPRLEQVYFEVRSLDEIDMPSVRAWIDRLADTYAAERGVMRLFAEVMAIEPRFSETISRVQIGIMRQLGTRFPVFELAAEDQGGDLYTRAALVIELIDHICSMIGLRRSMIDRPTAINFAAHSFLTFVQMPADEIHE